MDSVSPDRLAGRRGWTLTFFLVLPVFLLTADYGPTGHVDAVSALVPAWHLAHHGTPWLEDGSLRMPFFFSWHGGHLVSNREPGISFIAVPFYFLLRGGESAPSIWPAAVASATITAAAMATLFTVFRRLVTPKVALGATLLVAFGTSTWTISSNQLWSHGPNQLWILIAVASLAAGRPLRSGLAYAAAILTRPHLAAASAVFGLGQGLVKRSIRPVLAIGVPATIGLVALVAWDRMLFGHPSVAGGYGGYQAANLTQSPFAGLGIYVQNVLGSLVSAPRGIFPLTPFLLMLVPGLRAGWRVAPSWVKISALAGLLYMLIQWRVQSQIDGFVGGYRFYSYRLTIEWLTLSAPLLLLAYREWTAMTHLRLAVFRALAVLSIAIQAVGAFFYDPAREVFFSSWLTWTPLEALRAAGWMFGTLTVVATIAVTIFVVQRSLPELALRPSYPARERLPVGQE